MLLPQIYSNRLDALYEMARLHATQPRNRYYLVECDEAGVALTDERDAVTFRLRAR